MPRRNDLCEILEGATMTMERTTKFMDSLSKATCPESVDGTEISDCELVELMGICDKMLVSGTLLRNRLSLIAKSRNPREVRSIDIATSLALS